MGAGCLRSRCLCMNPDTAISVPSKVHSCFWWTRGRYGEASGEPLTFHGIELQRKYQRTLCQESSMLWRTLLRRDGEPPRRLGLPALAHPA